MKISVIIPVLNEAKSIAQVLDAIPKDRVNEIIVVDNGSSDPSPVLARARGAKVVHELRRGYGRACLTALHTLDHADIVVFLDGDYSDFPEELPSLVDPLIRGEADFVIGSRLLGQREKDSIRSHVLWRNRAACALIQALYRKRFTDIGPFRAIRRSTLESLGMSELSFGWHIEMQLKAAKKNVKTLEVPVRYRVRLGESKLSGNFRGSFAATVRTFWTIFRHRLSP